MLLPPGPASAPDLLNRFLVNPFQFLQQCQRDYGDTFSVPLGDFGAQQYQATGNWVFLTDPQHIRQLFNVKDQDAPGGEANSILFMQLIPSRGSAVIDGVEHVDRRRALSDLVVGKQTLERFNSMILAEAEQTLSQAVVQQSTVQQSTVQQGTVQQGTINLAAVFRTLSHRVMEKVTFGDACDEKTALLAENLHRFGDFGVTPQDKREILDQCLAGVESFLASSSGCPVAHTAEHTEKSSASDNESFTSLLNGLSSTSDRWQPLEQTQLRDELVTLLLGGADTTATSMSWTLVWLLKNPQAMQALRQELTAATQEAELTELDIEQLSYLDAVVKESSRISPMLFNSSVRLLKQPMQVGQYQLPVGTMVANCNYLVHHREDIYAEPALFKPERFLNQKPNPHQWIPFGGGIRRCIGMGFAQHEIKLALARLLLQYDIEDAGVSDQAEMQGSFFGPQGGVPVKLQPMEK